MSEQDKRPVYMGNFERFKKEVSIKQDDILTQVSGTKAFIKYAFILSGIAVGISLIALAI